VQEVQNQQDHEDGSQPNSTPGARTPLSMTPVAEAAAEHEKQYDDEKDHKRPGISPRLIKQNRTNRMIPKKPTP